MSVTTLSAIRVGLLPHQDIGEVFFLGWLPTHCIMGTLTVIIGIDWKEFPEQSGERRLSVKYLEETGHRQSGRVETRQVTCVSAPGSALARDN